MEKDFEKVLISESQIKEKVKKVAKRIAIDYEHKNLTIVSILNGSLIFLSDLTPAGRSLAALKRCGLGE